MKAHTNEYKEQLISFGKEIDGKITYTLNNEQVEINSVDLVSVTPHYEGALLKSVMKQLDFITAYEIPLETIVNFQFGLKVGNSYEYIHFNNYIVNEVEKQEDTNTYLYKCYDKMLYAMKDYEELEIEYPCTIRDFITALCNNMGVEFANEEDTFTNYDQTILTDPYKNLGYTKRDVLDQLAEVTASTICFNDKDKLEIRYVKDAIINDLDFMSLDIQMFSSDITSIIGGTTIQINGSATLTDVDTSKESRVLRLLGQTSQDGTPTPDTPIPVNVVSGDNTIDICGKNLLNLNGFVKGRLNQNTGQIEYANNVSSLVVNGNDISFTASVSWNNGITSDFIPIEQGKYFYRGTPIGDRMYVYVDYYDKNKNWIRRVGNTNSLDGVEKIWELTFNEPNAKYIRLHYEKPTTGTMTISNSMLEKSNTATTYEPYIGSSYPIYLGGKNLFGSEIEQGSLNSSGETTSSTTRIRSKDFISVGNNTQYTLSGVASATIQAIIYEYNNDTYIGQISSSWNSLPYTFTTNATTNKIKVVIRYSANGTITPDNVSEVQLEKGSIATNYNHYIDTPIELCKIETYQDYIYKENGSWYLHKEIGKVVFGGEENWTLNTDGGYRYYTQGIRTLIKSSSEMYCDKFITSTNMSYLFTDGYVVNPSSGSVSFCKNDITTLANWKTWLSNNNVVLYYILATPTTTLITDTTLLEQLEALQST